MNLRDAIDRYVAWRQSHGARFISSARILHQFSNGLPARTGCDGVSEDDVRGFLDGHGPLTRTRACKYSTLAGFFRYAISRGHAARSPLPAADSEPRRPPSAPPHVFSRDELHRLFGAIEHSRRHAFRLDGGTFRVLLLILYGAGLRIGEALRLSIGDVNLADGVLTVRDTKFFKNRLVPVDPQLAEVLRSYAARRSQCPLPEGMAATFLANRDGTPVRKGTVHAAFANLLGAAGIHRKDDGRRGPCLHSLRHTAAVHRLTAWYREGADVQRLLPVLSTWLGHAGLDGTKIYLSMTPALLQEASLRFERYVKGGGHE